MNIHPAEMNFDALTWGRWMFAILAVCGALYVAEFFGRLPNQLPPPPSPRKAAEIVVRFQGDEKAPPPPESQDRKVLRFFSITAAAILVLNAGFWWMARFHP